MKVFVGSKIEKSQEHEDLLDSVRASKKEWREIEKKKENSLGIMTDVEDNLKSLQKQNLRLEEELKRQSEKKNKLQSEIDDLMKIKEQTSLQIKESEKSQKESLKILEEKNAWLSLKEKNYFVQVNQAESKLMLLVSMTFEETSKRDKIVAEIEKLKFIKEKLESELSRINSDKEEHDKKIVWFQAQIENLKKEIDVFDFSLIQIKNNCAEEQEKLKKLADDKKTVEDEIKILSDRRDLLQSHLVGLAKSGGLDEKSSLEVQCREDEEVRMQIRSSNQIPFYYISKKEKYGNAL